ncbi:hypothetical protein [Mycobacterium sp. HUMS_1102779]|uniref:hypothetical protein n=1 Tax=Mycobacterium sp. HUMS_1102779 TaxID=3383487 RepID=UPI00389B0EDD
MKLDQGTPRCAGSARMGGPLPGVGAGYAGDSLQPNSFEADRPPSGRLRDSSRIPPMRRRNRHVVPAEAEN